MAFSPDGKRLAAGTELGTVRLYLRQPATPTRVLGGQSKINSVAFGPNGDTLISGSNENVLFRDLRQRHRAGVALSDGDETNPKNTKDYRLALSRDGTILVTANWEDDTAHLWRLRERPVRYRVLRFPQKFEIASIALSPDGQTLAAGGLDTKIWLWDLRRPDYKPDAQRDILKGHRDIVYSVAFSPDGNTLATGSSDRQVRLWPLHPWREGKSVPPPVILRGHDGAVRAVTFSPDGQVLASGGEDGITYLWDPRRPDARSRPLASGSEVYSVAFNPSGSSLAVGSSDRMVRLWNPHQPEANSIILSGHSREVTSVAFSPNGEKLGSGSWDGTVRIWTVSTKNLAEMVCQGAWRNLARDEWRWFLGPDVRYERTCPNLPSGEDVSWQVPDFGD